MTSYATKTIVLTGASRGLGRAMADGFANAGHMVIGCATNAELIDALKSDLGEPHDFQTVDTSDDRQVASWAKDVISRLGPPDLLLNNAALINEPATLWNIAAEEFDRLIDVNVKGVANVVRHFVPAMVEKGSGIIVNFSSGWGRSTSPEVAPYCASKFGVEGMTRALAQELPRGMAAIALSPGVINTDMLQTAWGEGAQHYPSADEWAQTAVPFLLNLTASDNGESLSIT